MSQFNDGRKKAFPNSAALARYLRVKITSGVLALAGVTDTELGTLDRQTQTTDASATVILRNAQGTILMVAAAAITALSSVYTAANGQISSTNATGSVLIGTALTAATAAGDYVEVLRFA